MQHLIDQTKSLLTRQADSLGGRAILAAVSGGSDSTVLALVLAQLAKRRQLPGPLVLAHIDHGQHPRSQAVSDQVEQLAEDLELGFALVRLDLPRDSSELSMREARYDGLIEIARRHDAGMVLTAHHADDDLETILFRLLRGTGLRGLCGIPELRPLAEGIVLCRPFLHTRRRHLHAVLEKTGVESWQDPSNLDLHRSRNFLRHSLIPTLRAEMGYQLDISLVAIARSAKAVEHIISGHTDEIMQARKQTILPWRYELSLSDLNMDQPFLSEVLRRLHVEMSGTAPNSKWLRRAEGMLDAATGQRLSAGGGLMLERTQDGLLVLDLSRSGEPPAEPIALQPGTESLRFGSTEWKLSARALASAPLDPSPRESGRFRALLDARSLGGDLYLRSRQPSDRFWPLGSSSQVCLRRFLQGRHVPRFDRDRLPLLVNASDQILWAPGVEIAESVKIRPDSGPCIEVLAERVG